MELRETFHYLTTLVSRRLTGSVLVGARLASKVSWRMAFYVVGGVCSPPEWSGDITVMVKPEGSSLLTSTGSKGIGRRGNLEEWSQVCSRLRDPTQGPLGALDRRPVTQGL